VGDVYPPSEDTVLLAKSLARERGRGLACDLGCGGLITVELAKSWDECLAVDVCFDACTTTWLRVRSKGLDARTHVLCCDGLSAIREGEIFDLIASNPPYLPVEDEDVSWSGGRGGIEVAAKFIKHAVKRLKLRGKIVLVISSLSNLEELIRLCDRLGLRYRVLAREHVGLFEVLLVIAFWRDVFKGEGAEARDVQAEGLFRYERSGDK